jgi:hypothetical protein
MIRSFLVFESVPIRVQGEGARQGGAFAGSTYFEVVWGGAGRGNGRGVFHASNRVEGGSQKRNFGGARRNRTADNGFAHRVRIVNLQCL